ncbi:MAG: TrpR-like protein YerC/YecD [Oscillospiraceae bacterium]|nr:TrpR-like protein YerC/YecD [Oscillospiraceae bacterium]
MYESKMKSEETDRLFEAILSLKDKEECYRFFDDLCTFGEILAMTQRFQVADELYKGSTFSNISSKISVSSTTITRVNKCLNYGAEGYKTVLDRRYGKEKE